MQRAVLIILWLGASLAFAGNDAAPANADLRKSIERSLPFLEKEGVGWMQQRKCISCHHVSFMIWSHNEARAHGFAVDAKKLDAWTDWSAGQSLNARAWYKLTDQAPEALGKDGVKPEILEKLKPAINQSFVTEGELVAALGKLLTSEEFEHDKAALLRQAAQPKKGGQNDGGGLDTVGQLLLGCAPGSEKMKEFLAAAPPLMARWQEADGSWSASGQLPGQNRPREESNLATTGWAALALASVEKHDDEGRKALDRAVARLKEYKPGKSTESLVVGILVELKFGTPDRAKPLLDTLLKQQNADGGWGWLLGGPSDAFATGQALYALGYAGVSTNDAALTRAQRFLLDTQGEDGSWAMSPAAAAAPATKPDRLKRLEPIYRYWGTAWAALGLMRTLPR